MGPAPTGLAFTMRLRPADHADWGLIDGWLCLAEIKRWWGSHASAQAAVLCALSAPMGLCSIIEADGVPVGYAHALDADLFVPASAVVGTRSNDPWLREVAGCYRSDVFVGERAFRGRGIGGVALQMVCQEIFATTLAPAAISIVSIRNEAAVRAHEKAGFTWVRVIPDPLLGPCWLMRCERGTLSVSNVGASVS